MANHLAGQSSLYLRQHAEQPVDWHVFGPEAFAEAAARDVPVFLSVGYAACHWCHVMAHESFDDPAVAAYLNAHFVPVKVDREERPDVDAVYMSATQAMTGQGGWPMSVFLLPDGRAFHAGTYFPPRPARGMPAFSQVLAAVAEAWTERRDAVEQQASRLAQGLSEFASPVHLAAAPADDGGTADRLAAAVARLEQVESPEGGFGKAPKFPPGPLLPFLTDHAASGLPRSEEAGGLAARTLAAMARSALRDQLDGGFCRYSVTGDWSVPHFEKMLYDNALLLRAYARHVRLLRSPEGTASREAWEAVFPDAEATAVVEALAGFLLAPADQGGLAAGTSGAFLSAIDADSEPSPDQLARTGLTQIGLHEREGAFALWTPAELLELLGEDGLRLARLLHVTERGSVSALGSPLHPGGALDDDGRALLDRARPVLLTARATRPRPAVDDKVVASWNAMTITALAEAGRVLGRPEWVERAGAAARYLREVHWNPGTRSLARVSHEGRPGPVAGLLEDYAHTLEAALVLFQVTGDTTWYDWARELSDAVEAGFLRDGQVLNEDLRQSSTDLEPLRAAYGGSSAVDLFDGATPAPVSVLAGAWQTLAALTGDQTLRDRALGLARTASDAASGQPRVAGAALAVELTGLLGVLEVAVVGGTGPERDGLLSAVFGSARPGVVIAFGEGVGRVPLLEGRTPGPDGTPRAYVCREMVCHAPVDSPEALRAGLR